MERRAVTTGDLLEFKNYLKEEEKSCITIEKYCRDVKNFITYCKNRPVTKIITVEYKKHLEDSGYAVRSVNSMVASINCFLKFMGLTECTVKSLKQQKESYCAESRELTKAEYMQLLAASRRKEQLNLVLQAICSTGIRVSELKHFTVEAVKRGEIEIKSKGKIRKILLPGSLKTILLNFAKKNKIVKGFIFITKNGNPLDRSNIWSQMKKLCEKADVNPAKVFPHNLRKLFARTFYSLEKDIAKLADVLGHSNIETTRIYIMTSGAEHRRKIERLGLIV